jgi:hypothetical protein
MLQQQIEITSSFAFMCLNSPSSSFALELSTIVQIQPAAYNNGDQPSRLSPLVGRGPQAGEATAWMAGDGVRWEDSTWSHSTH